MGGRALDEFDLRKLRERAGLSQTQLAHLLNISQPQLSKYERDPDATPVGIMIRSIQFTGMDPAELTKFVSWPSAGLHPAENYDRVADAMRTVREYSQAWVAEGASTTFGPTPPDIVKLVDQRIQKPNVVVIGKYDAGKSTVLNHILGQTLLPAAYQPMTRVPMIVRHLEDRPDWMLEEVLLLGSGFDPDCWEDEGHCQEHKVAEGGTALLNPISALGQQPIDRADFALVYADNHLLRSCNLVDFPGFDDEAAGGAISQDGWATRASLMGQILIYCSPLIGYMSPTDLERLYPYLHRLAQTETPLRCLYLLATHAHTAITDRDVGAALDKAAQRVFSRFAERPELTACRVRARMFPFWRDEKSRCSAFELDLCRLLSMDLPVFTAQLLRNELGQVKTTAEQALADAGDALLARRPALPATSDANDPRRMARERFIAHVMGLKANSGRTVDGILREICTKQWILKTIEDRDHKLKADPAGGAFGRKEAREELPGLISSEVQRRLLNELTAQSEGLIALIDELIDAYGEIEINLGAEGRVRIPFDATGIFIGGLAGLSAVGALSVWAASLGNLGAYIIAAKAVSLLAALGISISGGTATATALLASIGGPATVAVGIVLVTMLAGWRLLGDSWEERLAAKLVKAIGKSDVQAKVTEQVERFWDDTLNAFNQAARVLDEEYERARNQAVHRSELLEKIRYDSVFFGRLPIPSLELQERCATKGCSCCDTPKDPPGDGSLTFSGQPTGR